MRGVVDHAAADDGDGAFLFGAAFELPLLVVMANIAGVLPARILRKSQRLGIFLIFVFAAVATPSTDPFTNQQKHGRPSQLHQESCSTLADPPVRVPELDPKLFDSLFIHRSPFGPDSDSCRPLGHSPNTNLPHPALLS